MDIAVIVPGAAGRGACILHQPGIVFVFDCELVFPHVVAAQHIFTLSTAAKAVTARRQGDALFVALLGN